MAELIIGKQRNGPTGSIRLAFNKKYGKFQDLEIHYDDSMYVPPDSVDDDDGDFISG
jgi:replicative DNA helicase